MRPTRTEPPVASAGSLDVLVYTVLDLGQNSARILSQVEETRQPAFITRNGRFIAIIEALEPGQIESRVLLEISRRASKRGWALPKRRRASFLNCYSKVIGLKGKED